MLSQYESVFFLFGILLVAATAWQRFNEPSFPNRKTLPHALVPLRYLFLRPAYQKARFTYLIVSIVLYCMLVWPGPTVLTALGVKDFPGQAWALVVAVVMTGVGVAPDSLKWLNTIEEQLRRWIHAWFLVPDGIETTIGVLEDARYDPPPSQFSLVPAPLRERIREDLKLSPGTLRYRWARCTILMASLRQMGGGGVPTLRRAAFEPFKDDFETLRRSFKALQKDMEPAGGLQTDTETEENLDRSVDELLEQVYAYISWGIRSQADTEQEVDRMLEELGFRVPQRGGRRVFDIVAPAVLIVAGITMAFWLIHDAICRRIGVPDVATPEDSVQLALVSALAAAWMYGSAAFIALKRRSAGIEQKTWRESSARSLMSIAFRAGLVTWLVIIAATIAGQISNTCDSLVAMAHQIRSLAGSAAATGPGDEAWIFVPAKMYTALPWLLAGAAASAVLAHGLSGDVRRTDTRQRCRDAVVLGGILGLAVAAAQLIQCSMTDASTGNALGVNPWLVLSVGLAGLACGAVIGFMVPYACRANIVTPLDAILRRALQELLTKAETALGSRAAAENWAFMPHSELDGVTPAEAVQYKTQATGVFRLLDDAAPAIRDQAPAGPSEPPGNNVLRPAKAWRG